jgi:sodium-dependent dicarboxylate transporter 2/3/5
MVRSSSWSFTRHSPVMIFVGLGAALFAGLLSKRCGLPDAACWTAAVAALCAVWWVTEPIPIPVTSLVPFVAFPVLGVLDHSEVATAYGHTLILLLLGGFLLSTAMERSGAHRRLAVLMVRLVGGSSPRRLILGFMIACALLSMWISNTATTLVMLPIALALLERGDEKTLGPPLFLGIGYASSIGGLGTPIGTPPNVIFMGVYRETVGAEFSFLDWMKVGVPMVVLLIPLTWLVLTYRLTADRTFSIPSVGAWRPRERRVLWVFLVTALLWMTRVEPWGGWSALLGAPGAGDATVALGAVVVMFLLPDGEGERLLDWDTARKIPWGLLILFAGGIAIARAFQASGLSEALGDGLRVAAGLPTLLMLFVMTLAVCFLTEVTSNTATAALLTPVLAATAISLGLDPKLLMIPAVLATSCAFMLPVATVPNAVIYGSGQVTTAQMARTGFVLNLLCAPVIALFCYLVLG